jgi:uncharacterized protein YceK
MRSSSKVVALFAGLFLLSGCEKIHELTSPKAKAEV